MEDNTDFWTSMLADVSDADIEAYVKEYGLTPEAPSDPKLTASLTAAKDAAAAKGDSKTVKTLNTIIGYGDKILTILSKTGIIANKNLSGYSVDLSSLSTDTATSSAPTTTSTTVFGIDFSDKKTLIIIGLLLATGVYFLFFFPRKKRKK